jgi:2-polyprenyl-6-methoxyphenol hydroxylase-like FAD-dependent oxidoreductase
VAAADGVRSTVRGQLFPDVRPRYAGSTSWRAVIPDTRLDGRLIEVWGPSTEFGALRVNDGEIYWYGEFVHPEGASFPDELAAARTHFAGWSPWIRDLIAATAASQLMRHDVCHLPGGCPSYASGRVVLIGDAAHAMLPTIGQGAATALEDGVCVGRMIAAPAAAGADLAAALGAFDRTRRPRCRQLARQAILLARLGFEVGPGWRQAARNTILRLLPAGPAIKAGARITHWTPPG